MMIHFSDSPFPSMAPTHRRPLSFPAVRPCQDISPTTLLSSLITLSQYICSFQPKSFPTQRRNARETIRQITNLLLFFQEIRDRGSLIPILTFSDLHFILQKIHFLFQDCARQDTRIWMLIKSQFVASQFHLLIRSAANALHALPLSHIDVCEEVKELIELTKKQSTKVKLEPDPTDERESKRLQSVLNQFENATEPDVDSMKYVLDYVGIKTWNDCNKEIKFLENLEPEPEPEPEPDEEEVRLLSGLNGFLCYCRVVIFESVVDSQLLFNTTSEGGCSADMLNCVTPDDFRCPISLELMNDPVTVSTGQTYDRASIEKWLKAGNTTCPKTGETLTTTELFPNTALKTLIQQFRYDNGISTTNSRDHTHTITSSTAAAAHALQFASWFLSRRLVFGTDQQKNKAAYEIRLLAKSNVFNRACLVDMGTVPPLLDLLSYSTTQENAIGALLMLSKHASGREVIIESRGLAPIITVLKRGHSLEARRVAAATIFYLSSVKEYRKIIGENPEAIPGLVDMIKEGKTKNAVVAIFGLLLLPKNRSKVLAAGAVPAVISVLGSSDKAHLVTDCLAVLVALAETVEGSRAIFEASALALVIGLLRSATSRERKEYCVSILLSMCLNIGTEVVGVLVKDSCSLMPLLYALLTQGTPHAAKKARSLINVLQEFDDKRTKEGMVGSSASHQR